MQLIENFHDVFVLGVLMLLFFIYLFPKYVLANAKLKK